MSEPMSIAVTESGQELCMLPALANRHGLVTGATGTGKTVTLQLMAQRLSDIGVPVFVADVKGDLCGISQPGQMNPKMAERLARLGVQAPAFRAAPVTLWDVFGEKGHPLRATVSDMGPLLLARMLALNETQEGVLQLVFRIADERGLLLLDAKDLRAMLQYVGEHAKEFTTEYGNVSAASIGAIQRGLLSLDSQGADRFFGEPMLNLDDMMQTDADGRGVINVLAADKLMSSPRLYAAFLLWLLSDLYEHLPEVGDRDKPKFVFFFDEAHLLFNEAPKALLEKVEQVVRLVRSKGVGVYFVTQNPLDVPDTVLGQLGNRVQHALRAFTPRDQKAVQSAAQTLRANPRFSAETAITEMGVGEALVSFLDDKGRPTVVERGFVLPPASRIGPISDDERAALIKSSIVAGVYDQAVDRESAYEKIKGRTAPTPAGAAVGAATGARGAAGSTGAADARGAAGSGGTAGEAAAGADGWGRSAGGTTAGAATPSPSRSSSPSPAAPPPPLPSPSPSPPAGGGIGGALSEALGGLFGGGAGHGRSDSVLQAAAKSAARAIGSSVGREIIRGVLGSILRGR